MTRELLRWLCAVLLLCFVWFCVLGLEPVDP